MYEIYIKAATLAAAPDAPMAWGFSSEVYRAETPEWTAAVEFDFATGLVQRVRCIWWPEYSGDDPKYFVAGDNDTHERVSAALFAILPAPPCRRPMIRRGW